MNNITHTQVQELVTRLPVKKLPAAYAFLSKLTDEETPAPSLQVKFLSLSLTERRRLLAQQAEEMLIQSHYEETAKEREEWQGGDFGDY
ncbi:MAG: hypothetical protein KF770_31950 [Anaerolineae bacterium]|nr:hypothetical protein [Anaerolineae bacterium]